MLSKIPPRICCPLLNTTATPLPHPQCPRLTLSQLPSSPPPTIPHLPSPRSTSTTTGSPPLPRSSSSSASSSSTEDPLTWNTYLQLRRKRRHYNLLASVLTSMNTTAAGITILSSQNFEAMNIFGLDPFLVLGSATAISGALGWLLGPFVGNAVFGVVYRRIRGAIAAKDKDFYARIKRHRVDPSGQSVSNPVPDYYGEKIGSVREFRGWLKDQRAYNKKRQSFL